MSIDKNEIVVEMNDVNKWYGEFHVLKNVCLRVKKGENRCVRPVRVRQINDDPLHQPSGRTPAR